MTSDLRDWAPRKTPGREPLEGPHVSVEPMVDERRFDELYDAYREDADGALWRWLPYGPFADRASFRRFAEGTYLRRDPLFHAIVPRETGRAAGVASLMRIDPTNGVVEIGHIGFSPQIKRTRAASEAFHLLMIRVFAELGYRRYEWKCNDRNEPSKRAALRLGFQPEGVFRQHMVTKGENRDTAWFSIIDGEWPLVDAAFKAWLDDGNFDADGRQRRGLAEIRDGLAIKPA